MLKLFIVDGYLWIHRSYHASVQAGLTSEAGEPTGATHIFITSLLRLLREQEPDLLCVAMEGGGKTFRHTLSSEYKANRSIPADDFTIQRKRIEEILDAMNIPMLRVAGFEADDIIGTVARYAREDGIDVVICSKDKDMLQLVDDGIQVFYAKTDEYVNVVNVIEKVGVSPDKFIDCLALQGDAADNILGVPGIGAKTAAKLINEYGSITNLVKHISELKPKRQEALREHIHRLEVNKMLVTIDCKVPVEIDYYSFMMDGYDEDKLRDIFVELGFNQLLIRLGLDEGYKNGTKSTK